MSSGLLWTAVGSAAGVLGVLLVGWQIRLQLAERHAPHRTGSAGQPDSGYDAGGLPVAVPAGRLPADIRGRDGLLAELRRPLTYRNPVRRLPTRQARNPGRTWVLAGMGGVGKSTIALAAAQTARDSGWRVWWVNATDAASLAGGMLEILHQLHAPEVVTQAVRESAPAAAARAWEFLNGPHPAGRKWLVIFDNADTPRVLAAPGATDPADYAGWLRADPSGMVIITTRNKDPRTWGPGVMLRELTPLDDTAAAEMLADLAPAVPDPGGQEALDLGSRLGGLPLALHLAGSYLSSPFARWRTFADYLHALDGVELPAALADLDDPAADARNTIQRTWDLSLDALEADGHAEARPLLLLLSCYAPATPIPASLTSAAASNVTESGTGRERQLRSDLRALAMAGLIDIGVGQVPSVIVHPVVADANRARLRTTDQQSLPEVGETAVRQLQAASSGLDYGQPADWPVWGNIVPHIIALLQWPGAQLGDAALADLLSVSISAATALIQEGNVATAELLARTAITAASRLGDDDHASLAARHILAAAIEGQGHNAEAEQLYRDVLTDRQRILGNNHPDTLGTQFELAKTIGHQRFAEAEHLLRGTLTALGQVLGTDDPRTLAAERALAAVIERQGRIGEAEQIYSRVLSGQQQALGHDHPGTLKTRYDLAQANSWHGRHRQTEEQLRGVLADQQRVLGEQHHHVLSTRRGLALSIARQGRSSEAEQMYRHLLADQQRLVGEDHPSSLYTQLYLAETVAAQGRYLDAEQLYLRISDLQQAVGTDHPLAMLTARGLAQVKALQGRHGEAEELYRQVLARQQQLLGENHRSTLETQHLLGQVVGQDNRYSEAEQLLRQVLTEREQALGNDHPDTQATRNDLDQIIKQAGKRH
jgi:tetratricopeptide (TPR) repeat protein